MIKTFATLALSLFVYFFLPEGCPEPARRSAAILTLGALFWALELVPPFATSILVVLLLTLTLDANEYLIPFSSPVIILFFGGFVLARALHKYSADLLLSEKLLKLFGKSPLAVLAGFVLATGFLSMWISNTAAAAIMLGLAEGILLQIAADDPFRKGLILAIPFSANFGGIGTPIGSPPNIIAIGNLAPHAEIPFVRWMAITVPLMVLLLALTIGVLYILYRPKDPSHRFELPLKTPLTAKMAATLAIFCAMVVLWLTQQLHGIPEAIVALMGVSAFVLSGLLDKNDIRNIPWEILILMWGGLALGLAMQKSGLTEWILSFPLFKTSGSLLVASFCLLAFLLSQIMSNTAAASMLIPLAVSLPGENPLFLGITIALSCSFGMAFPISTPPNALAYGTGAISTREMFRASLPLSIIALILMLLGYRQILAFL